MEPLIPTVPILLPVAVPLDNDAGTDTSTDDSDSSLDLEDMYEREVDEAADDDHTVN